MSFQPLFRRFHETIQLKRFDENAELREKRDRILNRLRDNLDKQSEPQKIKFDWFNQGSYAMGTGVKPRDGDYDIDIGVVLNIDRAKYDPVTVKGWIYKAVDGHTTDVSWRRPCITVNYREGGKQIYHVDLAILAKDPSSGSLYLAIGKEHAAKEQQEWQQDDRKGFMEAVESRFSGEDAAQLRRVIRYLKRWKDVQFPTEGHAAPTGLALTVAAFKWFQPRKTGAGQSAEYDDLAATLALTRLMLNGFVQVWDSGNGRYMPRLSLQFPKAPFDDVLARMTNQQMLEFQQRLEKLIKWLEEASRTGSTAPLRSAFGSDFPEK